MVILRFEHSTLWIRVEQRNHSTMAALRKRFIYLISLVLLQSLNQKNAIEKNISATNKQLERKSFDARLTGYTLVRVLLVVFR